MVEPVSGNMFFFFFFYTVFQPWFTMKYRGILQIFPSFLSPPARAASTFLAYRGNGLIRTGWFNTASFQPFELLQVPFLMGKSPFLMGKLTISMAIFNSYVSLPEGTWVHGWFWWFMIYWLTVRGMEIRHTTDSFWNQLSALCNDCPQLEKSEHSACLKIFIIAIKTYQDHKTSIWQEPLGWFKEEREQVFQCFSIKLSVSTINKTSINFP